MLVQNMKSSRTGNAVANQFEVFLSHGKAFQSYSTVIAFKDNNGGLWLTSDWEYSKTTMQYFKEFAGTTASAKVIRERIAEGQYTLVDNETLNAIILNGN